MPARFLQSNLHEHNSIAMSRARDSAPPAKSWSRKVSTPRHWDERRRAQVQRSLENVLTLVRMCSCLQYNDAQVGMSSPTRRGETGVHTPVLTADALRVQHSAPFDNFAGTRAARSGIGLAPAVGGSPQGSPTHKEASAARKSLGHSTSASLLPHIKPTASAAIAAESEEAKQQPLQSSLSSPNLLQTLRAERLARDASTTKLVTSYHSHHVRNRTTIIGLVRVDDAPAD
jgi:hypothetical protein